MEEEGFISELHVTMNDLSKAGLSVPMCDAVRVQCVQLSEVYPLGQLCGWEGGKGVFGAATVWGGGGNGVVGAATVCGEGAQLGLQLCGGEGGGGVRSWGCNWLGGEGGGGVVGAATV